MEKRSEKKKVRELRDFDPSKVLNDFTSSGLDASVFESIDESRFKKAPNIVDFALSPEFLNATMLPKQIEMGLKLFAEYCPDCSDLYFLDSLYDQSIGEIRKNIQFLEHGVCPKCLKNRWHFIKEGKLNDYNEFAGCLGQRCIPIDSFVYTGRGIIQMSNVESGDIVSHGFVFKKIKSGKLKLRTLKTEINWDFKGSKNSHIVPIYENNKIVCKKMIDVKIGDNLILVSPSLFPSINNVIYTQKYTKFPNKYTPSVSTIIGMMCRKFSIENNILYVKYTDILFKLLHSFDISIKVDNGRILIIDKEFIEWFTVMTGGRQIPDGILQSTEECVNSFISGFISCDVNDGILSIPTIELNQIKELQMMFLNTGHLTMVIDGCLKSICLHIDDDDIDKDDVINLSKRGMWLIKVQDIIDGDEVEMADIQVPNTNIYVADGFLHHNSGKSKFIGIVANYVTHRFLCMPNPIRQFNQSAGDVLNISFAGLSEDKVEKNLWGPYIGFMESSPWFQAYHSFLDEKGKELKKPLYTKRKTYLEYFHKKILVDFYGSKGNSMRGDTRIFASPDEIGWMGSGVESSSGTVMNADAICTSLSNSLATMRMKRRQIFNEKNFDVPPILMASISSPSSSKDKIMKLVKASKTNPLIYGVNAATWDCNSDFTEEALLAEFASMDPLEFYRDFGAQPPLESNPFLSETTSVDRIAVLKKTNFYSFEIDKDKDALGDDFIYGRLIINSQDKETPRLLAFDLGSTKNAFGMSVFKLDTEGRPNLESGLIIKPSKNCKINLPWVYERLTVPLMDNYNVKYVFFDKWQSLDQVTRIRDRGINAQVYSLKYADMDNVRGMIRNKGVLIPELSKPMVKYKEDWESDDSVVFDEISATLGIQFLTVRDLGNRMTKPINGDDDMFRSFSLGVCALSMPKIIKDMQTKSEIKHTGGGIGVINSFSGGSSASIGSSSSIGVIYTRGR